MRRSRGGCSTSTPSMKTGSLLTTKRTTPGVCRRRQARRSFPRRELEEATQWIGGLDRIDKTRGILACHDLSATPFAPTGKRSTEETLFGWIVSDFGLNDAIESGLVKTPRVVIRDDGRLDRRLQISSLSYLRRSGGEGRSQSQSRGARSLAGPGAQGYYLLERIGSKPRSNGRRAALRTPPVMITVANRTETAARIKYTFDHGTYSH